CFRVQAEDGRRDRNVTGVQTCALPISVLPAVRPPAPAAAPGPAPAVASAPEPEAAAVAACPGPAAAVADMCPAAPVAFPATAPTSSRRGSAPRSSTQATPFLARRRRSEMPRK